MLLFEKLQEHNLEKYPNPERFGCIDHSTLKTWVYTPEKLDLSDPKYLHVLKCAECTRELIELRRLRNEQSARAKVGVPAHPSPAVNWRLAVFAPVVLCSLAAAGVIYWRIHSASTPAQPAQFTPVAVTIDLSQAGTTRGTETTTVPPVVLPRRVVTAHLILSNFSPGGNYVVSVTTDRNGASAKATGRAVANVQGFHTDPTVALDLRSLPPGTYFLATTHEGDPASYFYPFDCPLTWSFFLPRSGLVSPNGKAPGAPGFRISWRAHRSRPPRGRTCRSEGRYFQPLSHVTGPVAL